MVVDLSSKVVIVTGAARDRGIGRAASIMMAKAGATVVATDLAQPDPDNLGLGQPAGLERTAELCRSHGVPAMALALDVTDPAAVRGCVDTVIDAYGRVDVVFNNAGTPVGIGGFIDIPDLHWNLSWQVNVMGMVYMIRSVVPFMRESGGGSIINNASIAGLGAVADFAAYTTTKFAVIGLTKSAAVDFGPDGIRVNAVCPGLIQTQMADKEIELYADSWGVSFEESRDRLAELVPVGGWGTPEDIADAVAWLASDSSKYVSGVALPVTGGLAPGL